MALKEPREGAGVTVSVWRLNYREELWDNGTWVVAIWSTNGQKSITKRNAKTSHVPFERKKQETNLEVVGDAVGTPPRSPYWACTHTHFHEGGC